MQIRTIQPHELGPVLESLRIRGRDLGEGLDRFGALLTRERFLEIQAGAIFEIAGRIGETSPHDWTQHPYGNTQLGLMQAIEARLTRLAQDRRNDRVW